MDYRKVRTCPHCMLTQSELYDKDKCPYCGHNFKKKWKKEDAEALYKFLKEKNRKGEI